MHQVAGSLSNFANVATDELGMGMNFYVELDNGTYVEFVMAEKECAVLLKLLKEADPHE